MSMNKNTNTEASEKDVWLYSTGNFANNIIFMMVSLYVILLLHQYFRNISPSSIDLMVARLVDAVTARLWAPLLTEPTLKWENTVPLLPLELRF